MKISLGILIIAGAVFPATSYAGPSKSMSELLHSAQAENLPAVAAVTGKPLASDRKDAAYSAGTVECSIVIDYTETLSQVPIIPKVISGRYYRKMEGTATITCPQSRNKPLEYRFQGGGVSLVPDLPALGDKKRTTGRIVSSLSGTSDPRLFKGIYTSGAFLPFGAGPNGMVLFTETKPTQAIVVPMAPRGLEFVSINLSLKQIPESLSDEVEYNRLLADLKRRLQEIEKSLR